MFDEEDDVVTGARALDFPPQVADPVGWQGPEEG